MWGHAEPILRYVLLLPHGEQTCQAAMVLTIRGRLRFNHRVGKNQGHEIFPNRY